MLKYNKIALFSICTIALCEEAKAFSFGDIFKKEEVKDVIEQVASDYVSFSIVGEWSYKGSAVKSNSGDALTDLGTAAASSTIESNINKQLERVGIKAGQMTFSFKEDKTVVVALASGRTVSGTYEYDDETKVLDLKFAKILPIKANVEVTSSDFDILFKIDNLIKIANTISASANIESLTKVTDMLKDYENLLVGFGFDRTSKASISGVNL